MAQNRSSGKRQDEGDINASLLVDGDAVFHNLAGFEHSVWLRRLGVPHGEADFLLLNLDPPRIAVVEAASSMRLKEGTNSELVQLVKYEQAVLSTSAEDLTKRILASLTPRPKRRRGTKDRPTANVRAPMKKWLDANGERALSEKVRRAKREDLTALLLLYIVSDINGRIGLLAEHRMPAESGVRSPRVDRRICLCTVG